MGGQARPTQSSEDQRALDEGAVLRYDITSEADLWRGDVPGVSGRTQDEKQGLWPGKSRQSLHGSV